MFNIDISELTKLKAQVKERIDTEVTKVVRDLSYEIIDDIVFSFRAPVSSGSYVMGHRLGLDVQDLTPPVVLPLYQSPRTRAGISLKAKARAFRYPMNKKVIISNQVPYNMNIEYIGWESTPPYGTFRLAHEAAKMSAQHRCYLAAQKIAL